MLASALGMLKTMYDKIWDSHRIMSRDDGQALVFIDRHFIHDVTAPAFQVLRDRGLKPRSPERIFGTADHYVPTHTHEMSAINDPERRTMIEALTRDAKESNITVFGLHDPRQGIVHIVGPEKGLSLLGMTIVCAGSHTSTQPVIAAASSGVVPQGKVSLSSPADA
ncbi:aconitase family protein [Rhizobium sp. BK376]|uniref:aconitase family protein n=1 Tax=Rhizobium sp. BK376 TaxID=2512149 RepID=UPI00104658C7|nr:aconitase family protein [Rhizobium sp. BK376]TCR74799.1 aconitase family protein (aconitate hydratase) [Rhizobium sp. BK376]